MATTTRIKLIQARPTQKSILISQICRPKLILWETILGSRRLTTKPTAMQSLRFKVKSVLSVTMQLNARVLLSQILVTSLISVTRLATWTLDTPQSAISLSVRPMCQIFRHRPPQLMITMIDSMQLSHLWPCSTAGSTGWPIWKMRWSAIHLLLKLIRRRSQISRTLLTLSRTT